MEAKIVGDGALETPAFGKQRGRQEPRPGIAFQCMYDTSYLDIFRFLSSCVCDPKRCLDLLSLCPLAVQIVNICVDVLTEEKEDGGKRLKEGLEQLSSGMSTSVYIPRNTRAMDGLVPITRVGALVSKPAAN